MPWYDRNPRHAGARDFAMKAWMVVSFVAAGWVTVRVVDYIDTPGMSLSVAVVSFAVVYYLGKAIIRPR
jgi:hypothetical protein